MLDHKPNPPHSLVSSGITVPFSTSSPPTVSIGLVTNTSFNPLPTFNSASFTMACSGCGGLNMLFSFLSCSTISGRMLWLHPAHWHIYSVTNAFWGQTLMRLSLIIGCTGFCNEPFKSWYLLRCVLPSVNKQHFYNEPQPTWATCTMFTLLIHIIDMLQLTKTVSSINHINHRWHYAGQKVCGAPSDTVISQCHVPWPIDHNARPWICPIPSKYHAYIHSDTSTFNSAVGTAIHYTTYFFLHTGFTLQSDNQLKSIMCTCCIVT